MEVKLLILLLGFSVIVFGLQEMDFGFKVDQRCFLDAAALELLASFLDALVVFEFCILQYFALIFHHEELYRLPLKTKTI